MLPEGPLVLQRKVSDQVGAEGLMGNVVFRHYKAPRQHDVEYRHPTAKCSKSEKDTFSCEKQDLNSFCAGPGLSRLRSCITDAKRESLRQVVLCPPQTDADDRKEAGARPADVVLC